MHPLIKMSTIADISELRKRGDLESALSEAEALYNANQHDYYVALCLAWVYVDVMKQYATNTSTAHFCECLSKFRMLNLPIGREQVLYDNVLWAVRGLLGNYSRLQLCDKRDLDTLIAELQNLPVITTGDAYHSLLPAAVKIKDWQSLPAFVDWWNLNNLLPKDYQKQEYEGKFFMSLAEATYNALCRCMMACNNEEQVLSFVESVSHVISEHPDYQYLPYYSAKLLFKVGHTEDALEMLKPFARKKTSEFWVWQLLGDEVKDDVQKMMFYCKAALCGGKDELLVKMQEQVGFFLIRHGKFEMGKYLIEKVITTRARDNRNPSYDIQVLTKEPWWSATQAKWDNDFAEEQALGADEYLFGKMNRYEVLVTFVNTSKSVINFLTEDKRNGFFMDRSKQLNTIRVNDVLQIATPEIPVSGITKVRRWKKVAERTNPHFYKSYSGTLRKTAGGFGFVESVFVHAALAGSITDRTMVAGTAVMAFDKKKQCFGWKAISVNESTNAVQ